MRGLNTGNAKAPLRERKNDLYETPSVATEALLRAEKLPATIWEPACGRGAICEVLKASGRHVIATDLVDYGYLGAIPRYDFLMTLSAPVGVQAIVTNPPFKLAGEFVKRALGLCPLVIMLLRLAFLESQKRSDILDSGALARVHIFRNRLPMMHRDGWEKKTQSNAMAFAWFVWDSNHCGPATISRLSWETAR